MSRNATTALKPFAGRAAAASAGLLLPLLAPAAASAHHVMDFEMPQTFFQGLLSGLGHPIIGPDHLAFVLAVGLIAAFFARGYALALVFVGATLAGCVVHLAALNLPAVEPIVSASVIAAGALLALRRSIGQRGFAGLIGLAGVFHGYAYGESIVGAEPTPLAAYLIGFALVQSAIALGTFAGARLLLAKAGPLAVPAMRVAGGAIAMAGAVFFVSALSA